MKHACVDMVGQMPAVALKGSSVDDMLWLVRKYQAQGAALKDLMP